MAEYEVIESAGGARCVESGADSGVRTYGTFQHLVGLLSLADQAFIGLVGTLVMWLIKKKESDFLDDHGREALNFQISLLIYWVLFGVLCVVTFGVAVVLSPLMFIFSIVLRLIGCIRGAMAANRGEYYRYPMCIRLIPDRE